MSALSDNCGINDQRKGSAAFDEMTSEQSCTFIARDGSREAGAHQLVPVEHCLSVYSGNECIRTITCTPRDMDALVVGRLLTEGVINGLEDIVSLNLDSKTLRVDVELAPGVSFKAICPVYVPTYGLSGQAENNAPFEPADSLGCVVPISWNTEDIFNLATDFAQDTPVHLATAGSHSCYLITQSGQRFCCEDLGRHNALDKVIGRALVCGVDLSECLVFSSGRIPVDMISKVIRARIPILVTKAVPTNLSVELARHARLTLICSARPDSMKVFNDPMDILK